MDRRKFIGAVAGGLVVARSVAEAQPAAKGLGITIPQSLPLRADEVIQ